MKKISSCLLFCTLLFFSACSKQETTKQYIIPNSFLSFTGSNKEETLESFKELEAQYYTDAKKIDEWQERYKD